MVNFSSLIVFVRLPTNVNIMVAENIGIITLRIILRTILDNTKVIGSMKEAPILPLNAVKSVMNNGKMISIKLFNDVNEETTVLTISTISTARVAIIAP